MFPLHLCASQRGHAPLRDYLGLKRLDVTMVKARPHATAIQSSTFRTRRARFLCRRAQMSIHLFVRRRQKKAPCTSKYAAALYQRHQLWQAGR